jgi:plastocyanin
MKMRSHRTTRLAAIAVAATAVLASLFAASGPQRAAADGGVQNHPANVFVMLWHYFPDTVHVKQGQNFTFGNYDLIFGIPAHSLDEVVKDCSTPPFTGNNSNKNGCTYPRFSSGLVDHGYVHTVHGVDKLSAGTYYFTCQNHPFMKGTLIVE